MKDKSRYNKLNNLQVLASYTHLIAINVEESSYALCAKINLCKRLLPSY